MKRLEEIQEGESVIGALTMEHICLRKRSMELADEFTKAVRKVELDCELQDREPTKDEKRRIHQLKHEADIANMEMWKRLNDDFEAWETPIGLRLDKDKIAVLVKLQPNPLKSILHMLGGDR